MRFFLSLRFFTTCRTVVPGPRNRVSPSWTSSAHLRPMASFSAMFSTMRWDTPEALPMRSKRIAPPYTFLIRFSLSRWFRSRRAVSMETPKVFISSGMETISWDDSICMITSYRSLGCMMEFPLSIDIMLPHSVRYCNV